MQEGYAYYVAVDGDHAAYRGADAAEARAVWSKGVSDGAEYVVLEAIREQK